MRHTLVPRKRLGQHFLTDDNIARKIAASLHLQTNDAVIEIGAGEGALTRHLIGLAGIIYAIEVDPRAAVVLNNKFDGKIVILRDDALKVSYETLATDSGAQLRIVGNIPYNITTPLLFRMFQSWSAVRDVTFMMQREVARRLIAPTRTKDYGILAVATQFYSVPKILFDVSRECFYPVPAVTSSVVHLDFTAAKTYTVDVSLFHKVLRASFGKRRKILLNSLKDIIPEPLQLHAISAAFDTSRRPEELTVADFVALTNIIAECVH